MAPQSTSTLSYALDEATTEVAFQAMRDEELFMPTLASIHIMSGSQEQVASFGSMGNWNEKPEGTAATVDRIVQQFRKVFSPVPYAKIVEFTKEMIDFDKWGQVEEIAGELGITAMQTIDTILASLFINIENVTKFTAEDDLAIASTAHLNADGSNSQSNLLTHPFTYQGLKDCRIAMRELTGYEATTHLNLIGDELIYSIDLEEDAWQLVQTFTKPDTAERADNFHRGRYTGYAWDRLSDSDAWGMMDSRKRRKSLRFYDSAGMELESDASFRQKIKQVGGYMRFVMGVTDWRFIIWNNP